jgi:NitT/TauT family transport system substrate-binding protein
MKRLQNLLTTFCVALLIAGGSVFPAFAAKKKEFNIAWTNYVGWVPWPYAAEHGIVKKWADKYGVTINIKEIKGYVESINQYSAGKFDGVAITNMDALTIPAAGGVDTTAIIMGDYSNGNDAVVLKNGKSLADIKGRDVNMVKFSVSHYLLARGLSKANLTEQDLNTVNIADADIVNSFKSTNATAVVTWNPKLMDVKNEPKAAEVFDSSKIPGEIESLMVVNTATLQDNPELAKALVGAWYETIALLKDPGEKGKAARGAMAKTLGTDLAGFDAQLESIYLFYAPLEALKFTKSDRLQDIMDMVRTFCFEHKMLGDKATSKDAVGIEFPGHVVMGDKDNVKMRFDLTYMRLAAQDRL